MSVPLNMYPEKTWNVPSWLKCSCHQFGSGVVRMDVSDPRTVRDMSMPTAWMVSLRDAANVATSETMPMLVPAATVACNAVTWAPPVRLFNTMNVRATSNPEMSACARPAETASIRWLQWRSWWPRATATSVRRVYARYASTPAEADAANAASAPTDQWPQRGTVGSPGVAPRARTVTPIASMAARNARHGRRADGARVTEGVTRPGGVTSRPFGGCRDAWLLSRL